VHEFVSEVLALEDTTAGSTLTICVVNHERREATVLHAGDSVARLVPLRSRSAALCEEHRVEGSAAERDRLVVLGGRIAYATNASGESSGPRRLWPGGVAQARAIGDSDVGRFIEPRPFAHTVALPAEPCCIVVCSDGVWDAMLPADVDAVARRGLRSSAAASAHAIVTASLEQCYAYSQHGDLLPRDDTTCVVIRAELHERSRAKGAGCPEQKA